MATKYMPARLKQTPTDGSGKFTAILAAFGPPPDHQNEYFEGVGTFTESIERWRHRGQRVPVYFNHSYDEPNSRIGELASLQEIPTGLLVEGQLNLKNPRALKVYEAMLDGSLSTLSIGFSYIDKYKADDGATVITKADVLECTFTPIPAEPRAVLLDVKSRTTRATTRRPDRDEKARVGQHQINLVVYKTGKRFPEVYEAVQRAVKDAVDDENATVSDVREAATRAVERAVERARWAAEDAASAAKWGDYRVKNDLTALIVDLEVGAKRNTRVPNPESEIEVREHLRRHHGNDINNIGDRLNNFSLSNMNAMHARFHRGGGDHIDDDLRAQVDALVNDVRLEVAKSRADAEAFKAANDGLALAGSIDWAAQEAYDRERADREREALERTWAERDAEAANREAAQNAVRERFHGGLVDFYVEGGSKSIVDSPHRDPIDVHVKDATNDVPAETIRIPTRPESIPEPLRVAEPAPEPAPVSDTEPETIRLPVGGQVDEKTAAAPDNFSVPTAFAVGEETYRLPKDDTA